MSSEKDKQQRMPELFCVEINSKSIAIITGATLCIVNVKKKKNHRHEQKHAEEFKQ